MTCDKSIGQIAMAPTDFVTDRRDYFQNNYFKFTPVLQRRPHHRISHVGHQFIQAVLEGNTLYNHQSFSAVICD